MSGNPGPLRGRTILLTRPAESGEALTRALEALGARVERRPTIALEPPGDPAPARRALARIETYDWVLFTSANGVRFFFGLLDELGQSIDSVRGRLAAVGPATAAALASRGAPAKVTAESSRAEGLAAALDEHLAAGDRVLWVRPETARDVLVKAVRATGAEIDDIPFYRSVAAPGLSQLVSELCANRFDVAIFTSPSTYLRLLEHAGAEPTRLRAALERLAIVAIGEVTAGALARTGLAPGVVAAEPTDEGIVDAVRRLAERF